MTTCRYESRNEPIPGCVITASYVYKHDVIVPETNERFEVENDVGGLRVVYTEFL